MSEQIVGMAALQKRIAAVSHPSGVTRLLGIATVREARLIVRRKTGNLSRSIHVASVTETNVRVVASANYAGIIEHGSRPHEITPKAAQALRFAASPSGRRLSGAPRKGAAVVFARRVHHPGTKPYPFLLPGAKRAVASSGLRDVIVNEWNRAG